MSHFKRPGSFEFAMDFLGDPQAAEVRQYVERLERELFRCAGALASVMLDVPGALRYLEKYQSDCPGEQAQRMVVESLAEQPV